MEKKAHKYTVLLYYKYANIEDPEALKNAQIAFCKERNMKGRIIVAKEGINGTIEGTNEACKEYQEMMKSDTRFADIHWKVEILEEI